MKKLLGLIIVGLMVFSFVLAEGEGEKQIPDFVYLFHLYYDNNKLFVDRDVQFKYDVIPEKFIPGTLNTQFPFKGEVINVRGEVSATFLFDPRQGNVDFLKGKISVKAPFASDGQKVNFYDGQGNQVLSVFVSDSSFCNDDGVCNAEVGEDSKTCPLDCKVETPPPAGGPSVSVEPSVGGGGGVLKYLIYLIIIVGIVGGGWFGGSVIWRRWKGKQQPPMAEFPGNLPIS